MCTESSNTRTDAELMAAVGNGDMAAFGELIRRHQPTALASAYRLLARWDQAEDVVQEAFLRVHRAASSYTASAAFTTWLYRIIVNLCQDSFRKRRSVAEPQDELANGRSHEPAQTVEESERTEAVRRAIAALPERQRIAVVLHRYDGLSHEQIAEVTGWTRSAVESCLVRAYAQLRESLSDLQDF